MTSNYSLFQKREVQVVAISSDDPEMMERLSARDGIPYPLLADPKLKVVHRFGIKNPDFPLAIHSTYIADKEGRIYYRKVGRKRPLPNELLDAIDFHHGRYSQTSAKVVESDLKGYHIRLAPALLGTWKNPNPSEGLAKEDLATLAKISKQLEDQEIDPALYTWMAWLEKRDLPWGKLARHLAWKRVMSKRSRIENLAQELNDLPLEQRNRVARKRVRTFSLDERDAVLDLRALVSILDDLTESREK